ncbi:MAG: alpha/beta hydrolase [Chloroflexi bacterium]|nr:alpha/beta hydrolase [Chloroflexota bacterium]
MTTMDASGVKTARQAYGADPEQFGDLRLPSGSGPHPAIVYVHGGGYRAQVTLAGAARICASLTGQGYATWSIEYRRLGNGGGWPMTFDDALAAAAHLTTLAADARIDLARVFVAGQSAGGQLAIWLASGAGQRAASAAGLQLPSFRGVIALAPASDLRASAADPAAPMRELLGGAPEDVSARYAATSPIELVPIGLPQLVVHGTADRIVPYALSEAYVRQASASGDEAKLVTIDGADHLDLWNPTSTAFPTVLAAAVDFLQTVGAPA